jgi:hypothetical protein
VLCVPALGEVGRKNGAGACVDARFSRVEALRAALAERVSTVRAWGADHAERGLINAMRRAPPGVVALWAQTEGTAGPRRSHTCTPSACPRFRPWTRLGPTPDTESPGGGR